MGPGIVVVCISWPGHPGYQKNLDMEINRGAFKRARTPRLLKNKKPKKYISRKKNIMKKNIKRKKRQKKEEKNGGKK